MTEVATTRLSSKGQVVIPEEIRRRLGLDTGAQFVVVGDGDVVVLKAIKLPSMDQFDELTKAARKAARKAGMKRRDVAAAVSEARKSK
jgi:AbrB family looped-hinge helix DNA binding protein